MVEYVIMTGDWLYGSNLGAILLGTLLILLLSLMIGYWVGHRAGTKDGQDSQVTTIQAAVMGLLGLLLAFTFSMAAARYDLRRNLVLQESNAIGTAYLRTQMLPEPHRTRKIAGMPKPVGKTIVQLQNELAVQKDLVMRKGGETETDPVVTGLRQLIEQERTHVVS